MLNCCHHGSWDGARIAWAYPWAPIAWGGDQTGIGIAASVLGLSQVQAQLAGLAGDLGISRPNGRTQEEADLMGLELMARAGYAT